MWQLRREFCCTHTPNCEKQHVVDEQIIIGYTIDYEQKRKAMIGKSKQYMSRKGVCAKTESADG